MKVNELRIGNYFLNQHQEIDIVTDSTFQRFRNPKMDNDYGVYPIQLTEEWLLKFGFEKTKADYYQKGRFTYHDSYGWKILENWIKGWVNVKEPEYVHELQNLYFALTGQELEMKGVEK